MLPFTNIHTHVFTSSCVPDRFLMILPVGVVRRFPNKIKSVLDSKLGRWLIRWLADWGEEKKNNRRKEFDKYVAFVDVAVQSTQLEVFQRAFEAGKIYDHAVRIIAAPALQQDETALACPCHPSEIKLFYRVLHVPIGIQ